MREREMKIETGRGRLGELVIGGLHSEELDSFNVSLKYRLQPRTHQLSGLRWFVEHVRTLFEWRWRLTRVLAPASSLC